MKYIPFEGLMDKNTIGELIEKITEDSVIYFDSEGGTVDSVEMFNHFAKHCEHKIELVSSFQVSSSAFDLFIFSNTKKTVLNGCFAIIHEMSRSLETRDLKKPDYLTNFYLSDVAKGNAERWTRYEACGIDSELYKKYSEGDDIVITTDELRKIAKTAEEKYYDKEKAI